MGEREKTMKNRILRTSGSSSDKRACFGSRHKGFTLVELIVVLVVLAIVAAMIIPALFGYVDSGKEKDAKLKAQKALAATQTALSDLYNDAKNQFKPSKRAKIRELAGSSGDDGTEFTVWTEAMLWDGYTTAVAENIASYTVKKAIYKANDNLYFYYDGSKWIKYTSKEEAEAKIKTSEEKNVIYVWPYDKQDFAYIGDDGEGPEIQPGDEVETVTKLVTLNLDPYNVSHVYFVREGTTGKAGITSLQVVFWKKKYSNGDIETGYNWTADPVDGTDRFTARNNKIYRLFFEGGYKFIGWYIGERKEELDQMDWAFRNLSDEEVVQPYQGLRDIAREVFENNKTSFTMYISLPEGYSTFVVVDKTSFGSMFNPNGGASYTIQKSNVSFQTGDELRDYLSERGITAVRTDDPEKSSDNSAIMYSWKEGTTVYWWSNASTVYLPDDCSDFFNGKTALAAFDFTQFNTEKITDMTNMFAGSTNLSEVNFGGSFDADSTNNVTSMKGMFSGCEKLSDVDMDSFVTAEGNLTEVEGMFSGCKLLTEISFSESFDTSNVTSFKDMFKGCSAATSIGVGSFSTANVTDVSGMFDGCKVLTGLSLDGWSFANVTTMESTFKGCEALSLDFSDITVTNKLETLKNTFNGCKNLGSVDLNHWIVSNVTDMTGMFMNSSITYADLSSWDVKKATVMSGIFQGCSSLEEVDISDWNMEYIVELDHAFDGCESLETLTLPDGAELSACTTLNSAFQNCRLLNKDFAGMTTSVLTDVGNIFNGCESLTVLDLELWTVHVTSDAGIEGAFAGCTNLERIFAKDTFFVSSDCYDVDAFDGDENLVAGFGRTEDYNTKWSADNISAKMAWIDGTTDSNHSDARGYFTDRDNVISYAMIIAMGNNWPTSGKSRVYSGNNANNTEVNNFNIFASGKSAITGFTRYTGKSTVAEIKAYLSGKTYKVATDTTFAPAYALNSTDTRYYNRNNKVDGAAQPYQVYFWAEDNTIYWWSDATYVYINPNSVRVFDDWQNIVNIDLQGLDFSKQKNFAGEFKKCIKLERIIDGATGDDYALDTSSAEGGADGQNTYVGMNMMFEDCRSLQSLDISKFNTENVESMRAMFCRAGAEGFTVDFSSFDTSKVVTMAYMFYHGDQGNILPQSVGIKTLDLSSFSSESLMNVRGMFERNSTLEELSFGDGFTCESIKTETVGSEVRGIANMFMDCTGLTSLDISMIKGGENITSIENMFNGCTNLEVLDMSGFIGDKVTTKTSLFAGCNNLVSLDMRSFDGGLLTSFKEFLANKKNLQTVRLDSLNSASLTEVNNMFSGCNALTSVTFGDKFTCESVENMSQMFLNCSSLTTLDLSMINTSAASNMSSMFNGCTSLTGITFGDGFTCSAATNMSQMFNNCSSLKKLDLSRFDSENVTNLSFLLNGCSTLTEVKFGKSFTCEAVTNMQSMFKSCSSLQSLDLYEFNPVSLQNTQEMFRDCSSLKEIIVMDPDINGGRGFYKNTLSGYNRTTMNNSGNMFTGCTVLVGGFEPYITEFTSSKVNYDYARVSKVYNGVHQKGYFTSGRAVLKVMNAGWLSAELGANKTNMTGFERNTTLTKDEVLAMVDAGTAKDLKDESLSKISIYFWVDNNVVKWWSEADKVYTNPNSNSIFREWKNATTIDLQGVDFSLQTNFAYCFGGCEKLEHIIDGSNGNADYAIDTMSATGGTNNTLTSGMNYMFWHCYKLESVDLSKMNTSNVGSMRSMFAQCNKLTRIDASSFDTSNVTSMNYMFMECKNLTDIDVSSFNTSKVKLMENIFDSCAFTTIDISNFSSESLESAQSLFRLCKNLTRVKFGNKFTCSNATNISHMFASCKSLIEVDLKYFNTVKVTKTNNMFDGCSSLTRIYVTDPDDNDGYGFYYITVSGYERNKLTSSGDMFKDCNVNKLVGGYVPDTTAYDPNITNAEYACVSKAGQSGYFTAANVVKAAKTRPLDASWVATYLNGIDKTKIVGFGHLADSNIKTVADLDAYLEGKGATKYDISDPDYRDDIDRHFSIYCWVEPANQTGTTYNVFWWSEAATVYVATKEAVPTGTDLNKFNSYGMFNSWTAVTRIDLQGLDFSTVKHFTCMFHECNVLQKITNGSPTVDYAINTSAATDMRYMFNRCYKLQSLDLSGFRTDNVISMHNMFTRCQTITTLDLSTFNTPNLTYANSMFKVCDKLVTIYASPADEENGTGFIVSGLTGTTANDPGGFMFDSCPLIKGGNGTGYDKNSNDAKSYKYAHIDGEGGKPGYFTAKPQP